MANKLELTWYGKDDPIKVEPRLLIENEALSNTAADPDTENMLIHGDNLLALKALENKYAGQVKCIYIDPPYNTGAAFEHYDDNLEHSIWLQLMYKRIKILRNLLSDDGFFCCEIDDSEGAYLKVILDEIFGRVNYLNTFYIQVRYPNKTLAEDSDYQKVIEQCHIYAKQRNLAKLNRPRAEYDIGKFKWKITELEPGEVITLGNKKVEIFKPGQYSIEEIEPCLTGLKETWATGALTRVKASANELLVQNLENMEDRQRIRGKTIDFEGYNPKKTILDELRLKPEIDYKKCSDLLFKLITQVCDYYEKLHGTNGMQNIIMMYRRDISNRIYTQMMQHFYCENGFLTEEVIGTRNYNLTQSYSWKERVNLYETYTEKIQSVLFDGIKKGVYSSAKFDSNPELVFSRVLEADSDVLNWLRPASKEFNITYNNGKNYEPDFVVEVNDMIYLVEVKGENRLNDPDVIAKKSRAVKYCEVASDWGKANGYKEWRYLFIPSQQVMPNSSFMQLAKRF